MIKLVFLLSLLTISGPLFSQMPGKGDDSFNQCEGAINIFENGDFRLQFTGKKGKENAFDDYASLSSFNSENVIWISYIAPERGDLTFRSTVTKSFVQMVVLKKEKSTICEDIKNGVAEIQRLNLSKEAMTTGLDYKTDASIQYKLELQEGQHIMIAFATESELTSNLMLQWQFIPASLSEIESKVVDRRYDNTQTTLKFSVIDQDNNQPLISTLTIEGNRDLDGLYVGSEFYFNLERNVKITVKCDLEGYFFFDSLYEITTFDDVNITIPLDRVSTGKKMTIEEIEFVPGSSEIMESSMPNLKRLKDFLALNSDLNVEIQGHVFAIGDNTIAAQRVSEARAKRVMKYLVDNGIDKNRLTAVGYGNTQPIYEKPKFFYEEQANRRVEVLVK